ncbi:MAG: hypothetical protein PHO70_00995 [Candidatus Omnitrophica bacterium]|nr:hypothetical protein [Candidatus Omnitrophota bacterium]
MAETPTNAPAQEEKPKAEKQTNCLSCNKPIKKTKRYYRNGKYYCSKKCWSAFLKKGKEEKK